MSELPEPLRAAVEHGALVVAGTPESPVKHILAALAAAWPSVLAAEEVRWWKRAEELRKAMEAERLSCHKDLGLARQTPKDSLPRRLALSLHRIFAELTAAPAPEPPALVGELRKLVEEWRKQAKERGHDWIPPAEAADRLAALLGEEET